MSLTPIGIAIICAGSVLLLIALVGGVVAARGESRLRAIQDTPQTTARDIQAMHRANGAYGQACEIAGTIECDNMLSAPLSGQTCIAYRHTLHWEDWGKPGFFDRRHGMNDLVYRTGGTDVDERYVPNFWVCDATGRVLVDPSNAELDLQEIDTRYDVVTSSMGDSERRTRQEEKALPLGQVYVLGYLGEHQGQPVIQRHRTQPSQKFLISYRSEQELTRANSIRSSVAYFLTGISGSLGLVLIAWELLLRRGR